MNFVLASMFESVVLKLLCLKLGKSFRTRPGLDPGPGSWPRSKCTTIVLPRPTAECPLISVVGIGSKMVAHLDDSQELGPGSSPCRVRKLLLNFKFTGFPRFDVLIRASKFSKMSKQIQTLLRLTQLIQDAHFFSYSCHGASSEFILSSTIVETIISGGCFQDG
jgi:hypothetical protein